MNAYKNLWNFMIERSPQIDTFSLKKNYFDIMVMILTLGLRQDYNDMWDDQLVLVIIILEKKKLC